ncbi:MAG: Hsp20/alpha crystallin family protein [Methanobrevibacter sp.]|jgi:HSP20 family protein|nr:Hsp20/alpha crystallin family protein [Candidatus Methanovirga australis]
MDKDVRLEKEERKEKERKEKEFIGQEIIDKHLKIGKDIAGKVANDLKSFDLGSIRNDIDSKIKDYTDNSAISVDLLDLGDIFYLKADLPGVDKESVNVEIVDRDLTIQGYFTSMCEDVGSLKDAEHQFLIKGRNFGDVKRTITLPQKIKVEEIKGELDNGVLFLRLPKVESKKVKIDFN